MTEYSKLSNHQIMETKSIIKYQHLLNKAWLIDQTILIDTLIKEDKQFNYFNSIFNMTDYNLSLSDGEFSGTDDLLEWKKQHVNTQLNTISLKLKDSLLEKDHREILVQKDQLEADITKLEEAVGKRRQIFYWYLVPYWFSAVLLDLGETVFRQWGCNFWGVSSLLENYLSKEQVLLDLMDELEIVY